MSDKGKPLVSVVLATYNGGHFLAEQIDSILAQTYDNIELIASDDGSSDNTLAMLAQYSRNNDMIILANDRNIGSTGNFERGIAHARGQFIAFSDQDDLWMPDKIERSVDRLMAEGADLVFGDARLVDAQARPFASSLWEAIGFTARERASFLLGGLVPILLRENVVNGATLVVSRDLALKACPMGAGWVHDGWIALVAAYCSARIALIDDPLMSYRIHDGQQVGIRKTRKLFEDSGKWFKAEALAWEALAAFLRDGTIRGDLPRNDIMLAAVEAKAAHLKVRRDLPDRRIARVRPMMQELFSGRYFSFARGLSSAAKDLFIAHNRAGSSGENGRF